MPQNVIFLFLLVGDELSNKEEALQKAYAVLQHLYLMYFHVEQCIRNKYDDYAFVQLS